MPDNITAPGVGTVLASDEIGGVHFPRSKVAFGADGTATDVSEGSPLPVALPGLATVGTRAYGEGQRIAVGETSAATAGLAATEVLLHAKTACYVRVGTAATLAGGIPLEAGEKFHLRLNSGQQIHVIRDAADGFLHIVPVA